MRMHRLSASIGSQRCASQRLSTTRDTASLTEAVRAPDSRKGCRPESISEVRPSFAEVGVHTVDLTSLLPLVGPQTEKVSTAIHAHDIASSPRYVFTLQNM
jgi:hypothetical protein